jgi:hypothetical protein
MAEVEGQEIGVMELLQQEDRVVVVEVVMDLAVLDHHLQLYPV